MSVSPHVYRTEKAGTGLCFKGRLASFLPSPFLPPVGICIRESFPFFVLEMEGKGFKDFVFLGYIWKARGETRI